MVFCRNKNNKDRKDGKEKNYVLLSKRDMRKTIYLTINLYYSMKKIFSILVALVAMVSFQGCVVDETDDSYSASPKTLEATNVTSEGFTLSATIEFSCGSACTGDGGILWGRTADLTHDKCIGNVEERLKNGTNNISGQAKNYLDVLFGVKQYYIEPGETLYYRAYAKVYVVEKGDQYVYGDVKSVVIPKAEK